MNDSNHDRWLEAAYREPMEAAKGDYPTARGPRLRCECGERMELDAEIVDGIVIYCEICAVCGSMGRIWRRR